MRLLAVDTATTTCSVALLEDRQLVGESTHTGGDTHSRHLMSMIDGLLAQRHQDVRRLDGIAVTRGPGTFTGLRIGISTVKGLAAAVGIPVVGVNSLAALAYPLVGKGLPIVAVMDARRGEVYHARFDSPTDCNGDGGAVDAPDKVAASVPRGAVLVGGGAVLYRQVFRARCRGIRFADDAAHVIRAFAVGRLALHRFASGDVDAVGALVPKYIRPSDAQIHPPASC